VSHVECEHGMARACILESDAGVHAVGIVCHVCGSFAAWNKLGPYWEWGPELPNRLTSEQMPNGYPEGARLTIIAGPRIEEAYENLRAALTYAIEAMIEPTKKGKRK
jgi:hypothetical protein